MTILQFLSFKEHQGCLQRANTKRNPTHSYLSMFGVFLPTLVLLLPDSGQFATLSKPYGRPLFGGFQNRRTSTHIHIRTYVHTRAHKTYSYAYHFFGVSLFLHHWLVVSTHPRSIILLGIIPFSEWKIKNS